MTLAWPFVSVVEELTTAIVSVAPRLEDIVTVFPETGFELASKSLAVAVEVVVPSGKIELGAKVKVETPALAAPAVKDTVAVLAVTEGEEIEIVLT